MNENRPNTNRVAVVGATGMVGLTIARVLEERGFRVDEYVPVATEASGGKEVFAMGRKWPVLNADAVDFKGIDTAFFTAGAAVSRDLVPKALVAGCRVIDNTTAFRMDDDVPLVVPEINGALVTEETRLVACPNCTAIILAMTLAHINETASIDRVVVTSFQSVSGAGRNALNELNEQTIADAGGRPTVVSVLPKQIAFNSIPLIGDVEVSGYSREEEKIVEETQKILNSPEINVVPTAVRVSTRVGHALSVNLELNGPLTLEAVRRLWQQAEGVTVVDDLPTPIDAAGKDDVIIARLRRDPTRPHAISYWAVGDNLRKGAATNSVQIAELMTRKD